jgi:hypothetical protein
MDGIDQREDTVDQLCRSSPAFDARDASDPTVGFAGGGGIDQIA